MIPSDARLLSSGGKIALAIVAAACLLLFIVEALSEPLAKSPMAGSGGGRPGGSGSGGTLRVLPNGSQLMEQSRKRSDGTECVERTFHTQAGTIKWCKGADPVLDAEWEEARR